MKKAILIVLMFVGYCSTAFCSWVKHIGPGSDSPQCNDVQLDCSNCGCGYTEYIDDGKDEISRKPMENNY